ncbi:MAG: hypothetical protein ACXVDZ_09820 [Bacteroidia bacterium]
MEEKETDQIQEHINYLMQEFTGKSLDCVLAEYSVPELMRLVWSIDFLASL